MVHQKMERQLAPRFLLMGGRRSSREPIDELHARGRVGATLADASCGGLEMRYIVAWMLGVPFSVIVLWYVVGHAACGR
jgi:hypothetical protein